jgi:hypothetical protein
VLLGRNWLIEFIQITAINEWGESAPSDWLVATPSDFGGYLLMMVNAVNSEPGNDYLIRHGLAMQNMGLLIGSCTNEMIESGEAVFWGYVVDYVVGDEDRWNYALSTTEIEKIKTYLQNGGNLFLSGLEIAYDLHYKGDSSEVDFCENFLKLQCVSDRPNDESNTYYDGVLYGLDSTINFQFDNGNYGSYNVGDPDGILPVNGGYQSAYFPGYDQRISGAGVAYSGLFPGGTQAGRVFTLSVPFETIVGDSVRESVMDEILNFLIHCDVSIGPVVVPESTELFSPYPNPFNPSTTIRCDLSERHRLDLIIYDLQGKKVHTLFSGEKDAGKYAFTWRAENVPSGIYLSVMNLDGKPYASQKMILIK